MVKVYSAIDIGTRKDQQDCVKTPDDISLDLLNERGYIAALCDGMGGLSNGALASQTCADLVIGTYYSEENKISNIPKFFEQIVQFADEEVSKIGGMGLGPGSCGTTLVSCCIKNSFLYMCAVGDSRIYLIRQSKIIPLNTPHNVAETEKNRRNVQNSSKGINDQALTSYVGMDGVKYIDINSKPIMIHDKDTVMLCSDGLSGALSEKDMLDICIQNEDADICRSLLRAVKNKGLKYQDNTSVIIMCFTEDTNGTKES